MSIWVPVFFTAVAVLALFALVWVIFDRSKP